MTLVRTTLTAACTATDIQVSLTAATNMAPGHLILIEAEMLQTTKAYVTGSGALIVPAIRGYGGTEPILHPSGAGVVFGSPSDSEWGLQAAQTAAQYLSAGRARKFVSVTATSTLTLPPPGADILVELNGTSVITLTVPVPTKAMDGTVLEIIANGAAAHVLTFTGGLSGAGGSYDIITVNATAPIFSRYMAMNSLWIAQAAIPIAGTVTNVTGTLT